MLPAARPREPAISRFLVLSTLAGLRQLDVDLEPLLARLNLRISDLGVLPERIQPRVMHDLWEAVEETTGQQGFGLRIASGATVDQFSTFGRVLATSATIGDALARGVRLFRLLSERQRFVVRLDGPKVAIVLETVQSGQLHREGAQMLIGGLVTVGRQLSGRRDPPLEVRFCHDPPANRGDVEKFFGCKVQFRASENSVTFDSQVLLLPILGHDPDRCKRLQREAEALLSELEELTSFRQDVANAIYGELEAGDCSIRRVAARLGMHPKALSRALRSDGTTYRELLEQVRLHLARRYLEQPGVGVTEIAFRLGYSEKSAFYRAFKRWTGQTPDSYREDRALAALREPSDDAVASQNF